MKDFIIIAIVVCIVIGVSLYLLRAKKRGEACIGCPAGKQCCGKCGSSEKP